MIRVSRGARRPLPASTTAPRRAGYGLICHGLICAAVLAACSQRESAPASSPAAAPSTAPAPAPASAPAASAPPAGGQAFKSVDLTGASYGKALEMSDTTGKTRTLDEFRGKVLMIFFGYTSCPDVCPTTLARAAEVKKALGDKAKDFQVLFVSLDPDRDTPEVLDQYVHAFDPGFIALRPDPVQLARGTREFKVFYMRAPSKDGKSYTIDHTAASYVIDREGRLRLMVKGAQPADEIAGDIRQLL